MHIGIPKEIKNHEYRVALTPDGTRALTAAGHEVWVETGAGVAIGFSNADYLAAGARIVGTAEEAYVADLVVKVKEPQPEETAQLRPGQILFCYLHLAAAPELAHALMAQGVSAIAYETVTENAGGFPLLRPMSEIAGRMAPQMGALGLMRPQGGNGTLVCGVPGVPPARILIIGGGIAGMNAARVAVGLGARVHLLDLQAGKLHEAESLFGARCETAFATAGEVSRLVAESDIVIGAAMVAGRRAPRILSRQHMRTMRPGSAFVDIAIDQGGIAESSRPTTHSDPFYVDEGVVHYCVTNMPGAVARTSTLSLCNATLPFVLALANHGLAALDADPHLRMGLQVQDGRIVYPGLADDILTSQ